jgi:hypothetical protein
MSERTVIRAGYGVSYRPRNSANQQYPAEISDNFVALSAFSPAVGRGVDLGMGTTGIPIPVPFDFPANGILVNPPLSNSFSYRQPDNPKAYVQSWNLAIQRALPGDFAFEAAYIGNHAVNTSSNVNLNAGQVPGLGSGGQIFNGLFGKTAGVNMHHGLHSSYNALQVKLNRPFQNGFMLTTAYTFSKAIDFCTDNCSAPVHALNYRHLNRGRSNTDFTHMFVQSYMYELPFGPGKSRLQSGPASWILGGWQVNGFLTLQSGAPINITVSSASLNMPGNTNRPDQIVTGEPAILGNIGPGQKFFDVTAFAQPGPARFGTVGRNIMQGPGTVNLDASLFKNFNIREGMRLQLRIESFNFTNTPSFVNPNGNFSAATFGEVTSTSPELSDPQARRFQFGLKLIF